MLAESGVADVTVVADRTDPIRLYPGGIRVEPQATTAQFDAPYPDGADYVVVPAMEPRNDPAVIAWIKAQHGKGAKIVSVCDGSLTLAAAGLLDGRRATGHWYSIKQLQAKHPTMQWVRDRRYVVDRGVATSTGITASIPLMMALVEAIGGRAKAEKLAMRLGVANWDARHSSSAFQLTFAHRKTFVRNRVELLAARNRRHQGRRGCRGNCARAHGRCVFEDGAGQGGHRRRHWRIRAKPARPAPPAGRTGHGRAPTPCFNRKAMAGPNARPRAGAHCVAL